MEKDDKNLIPRDAMDEFIDSVSDAAASPPQTETRSQRRMREEAEAKAERDARRKAEKEERRARKELSPEDREKRRGRRKRIRITVIAVAAFFALAFAGLAIWGLTLTNGEENYPNVLVSGIDVGGMTRAETLRALEENGWKEKTDRLLTVKLPVGISFTLDPCDAGIVLTAEAAADMAHSYGRGGTVFENIISYIKAGLKPTEVTAGEGSVNSEYIRSGIFAGTSALASLTSDGSCRTDYDAGTLTLIKGGGQTELDEDTLYDEILAAFSEGKTELEFSRLKKELKMPDFRKIYDELAVEPVNAAFDEKFEIIPETPGCTFDIAEAERLWSGAELAEKVEIKLEVVEPELRSEDLAMLLYCDRLGGMTTYWGWSTADRIGNIKLAMDKINGVILLPGETFSYNETVGQRTAEAGFGTATTYSDGQVIEEIGGGICQVSSTLYCAAMYSQMKTVTRTNHYFRVDYLDYGMDATVSWTKPDFKFSNSRDYPVKIHAWCDDESGTVNIELWGTDTDGSYVKLRHTSEEVYDETWTDTLIGYKVQTFRDIYDADGALINTVAEPSGVYYFHDDKIDWPEEKLRQDELEANGGELPDDEPLLPPPGAYFDGGYDEYA